MALWSLVNIGTSKMNFEKEDIKEVIASKNSYSRRIRLFQAENNELQKKSGTDVIIIQIRDKFNGPKS